ncbi:ribosomal protein L22 [Hypoxylon sp. FL1284]|nr:ribosomal protein L22 [Hypoxylon sp. FL1284]
MSLHLPARRIATSARTTTGRTPLLLPRTQRRNAGWFNWGRRKSGDSGESSALTKELTRREREQMMAKQNADRTQGTSIFDEEIKGVSRAGRKQARERRAAAASAGGGTGAATRVKEHMERADDPDPRWRVRFLKRKVMQQARVDPAKPPPRDEVIRRTERQHTSASDLLPTSTKKLVHLSRQIAGKTVDEALTQMRFSKKKMAREVAWQLEEARDRAVAAHGMGLGSAAAGARQQKQGAEQQPQPPPRKIQTKDCRWIEVRDPTTLYVDQSWVTKNRFRGKVFNWHGRARMSFKKRPTAVISLVLKEEKTRIRQHEERVEAQAKKAPWVHLPNRPVTAQRQYYSW